MRASAPGRPTAYHISLRIFRRQVLLHWCNRKKLADRVAGHCEDATSAIYDLLADYADRPEQAVQFFKEIDTAEGYKRAEERESALIKSAFFDAQFDGNKPWPRNKITHDIDKEILEKMANIARKERIEPREHLEQKLAKSEHDLVRLRIQRDSLGRAKQEISALVKERDALARQLSEAQRMHQASSPRLVSTERSLAAMRSYNDVLVHQLSKTQEHYENRLSSIEQDPAGTRKRSEEFEQQVRGEARTRRRLERKARGDARERKRLERKLRFEAERHKREIRRHNKFFLAVALIAMITTSATFIVTFYPSLWLRLAIIISDSMDHIREAIMSPVPQ